MARDVPTEHADRHDPAVIDAVTEWPDVRPPRKPSYPVPLVNGQRVAGEKSPLREKHDTLRDGVEELTFRLAMRGEDLTQSEIVQYLTGLLEQTK